MILFSYVFVFVVWLIAHTKKNLSVKFLGIAFLILSCVLLFGAPGAGVKWIAGIVAIVSAGLLALFLSPLKKKLLTVPLYKTMKAKMPKISDTEMTALEAGDTWWDKELFSANPNYDVLKDVKRVQLTEAEQSFMDNEVAELCAMIDSFEVRQNADLPAEAWEYIKKNKFFGIIIPKEYGGLGFSHTAHSLIVSKLASRSSALGISVMVPNSLGPGELLVKYGTQAQKDQYLNRLANGQEIPCFSLTSDYAGSDAGNILDSGIVCEGEFEGKKVLGLRVNWKKRYITLSPVATLVGLAFKAYDPDKLLPENHYLHGQEALGITCALIPRDTKGVTIGNRHNPLGVGFMNGPNEGDDVFIPMSYVIGGVDNLGKGWRMLMECLSIGRGISLPSTANVGAQFTLLTTSAYANTREQFGIPVAKFEGVAEKLAQMVINAYVTKSNCIQTTNVLDKHIIPSTISAIVKYRNTEKSRDNINHAMDIQAGRAVIAGPKNYLVESYLATPVGITVEGANILTRNLMVFGQGVMRCHPHLFNEVMALNHEDKEKGLNDFDTELSKHLSFSFSNFAKLLGSKMFINSSANYGSKDTRKYFNQLNQMSLRFSFLSDLLLLFVGGDLKRKEIISGELADALSALYEMTAVLNYYDESGHKDEKLTFLMGKTFESLTVSFNYSIKRVVENIPAPKIVRAAVKFLIVKNQRVALKNNDLLKVAALSEDIDWVQTQLCPDVYVSDNADDEIRILIDGYKLSLQQRPILRKLAKEKIKYDGRVTYEEFVSNLEKDGKLSNEEATLLVEARKKIFDVIRVDDFTPEDMLKVKV